MESRLSSDGVGGCSSGELQTWWLQDNGLKSQEEVPRPIAKIKTY
jgi:hypothetical protein